MNTPRWVLDCLLRLVNKIRAKEELRLVNVLGMGSGNMKPEDFKRSLALLQQEAGVARSDVSADAKKYNRIPVKRSKIKSALEWLGRDSSDKALKKYEDKGLTT